MVHCKTQTAPSGQRRCLQEGDKVFYKQAKYTLEKETRVAKRNYSEKLRIQFTSSNSASVWKDLKEITNYKTAPPPPSPALWRINNWQTIWMSSIAGLKNHPTPPPQPLASRETPLPPTSVLQISEDDVRKQKRKKAPGPDCVTPVCLKSCADQLAPIFTQIFDRSLELCKVPSCFKRSTIIPIPKKSKITWLNDYNTKKKRYINVTNYYYYYYYRSVKLLKFADETTLIGFIQDGDESKELVVWCSLNNLELNTFKTVEMIVDFRRNPPALPLSPSWTAL